jgi:hypothetical protein
MTNQPARHRMIRHASKRQHIHRPHQDNAKAKAKAKAKALAPGYGNVTKLEFIHIPKTAGGTISESAYKQYGIAWGRQNPSLYRWNNWNVCPCSGWHVPPSFRKDIYTKNTFCVVRNPYDRLQSEYTDKHRMFLANRDRKTQVQIIAHYNRWITNTLTQLRRTPYMADCHLCPQYRYATDCTHVLRYETLQPDFDRLMHMYEIPLCLAQLTKVHVRPKHTISRADISNENIRRINDVYAKDFMTLDYPRSMGMDSSPCPGLDQEIP